MENSLLKILCEKGIPLDWDALWVGWKRELISADDLLEYGNRYLSPEGDSWSQAFPPGESPPSHEIEPELKRRLTASGDNYDQSVDPPWAEANEKWWLAQLLQMQKLPLLSHEAFAKVEELCVIYSFPPPLENLLFQPNFSQNLQNLIQALEDKYQEEKFSC